MEKGQNGLKIMRRNMAKSDVDLGFQHIFKHTFDQI